MSDFRMSRENEIYECSEGMKQMDRAGSSQLGPVSGKNEEYLTKEVVGPNLVRNVGCRCPFFPNFS